VTPLDVINVVRNANTASRTTKPFMNAPLMPGQLIVHRSDTDLIKGQLYQWYKEIKKSWCDLMQQAV
jgi:hypothetical protein